MIVLKNLARDYNLEPHVLRRILRDEYGKVKRKRWSWETEKDKELIKVRKFLASRSKTSLPGKTNSAGNSTKEK